MIDFKKKFLGKIKTLIQSIIIIYITISLYAFFTANLQIFQPPRPPSYNKLPNLIHIPVNKSQSIAAVYLANPQAKYTIIYSHGNAEDLGTLYPFLNTLKQHGFSVLGYDYSGYGLSSGKPTEDNTYRDVIAAYNYATEKLHIPANHIISMGHSLGTGVAVYLSEQKPTAGLILMSPFLSAFRVITKYPILLGDKYNNLTKIKNIHTPLLIIHGTKDKVISFWHGKTLYKNANQPKEFVAINGGGHNNLPKIGGDKYWSAITKFPLFITQINK